MIFFIQLSKNFFSSNQAEDGALSSIYMRELPDDYLG